MIGVNDLFAIWGLYKYLNNELYIYIANGREIYHAKNYKNDWDGKYQGKKLVACTYLYVLETGLKNESYKGHLQIEYYFN